MKKIKIEKVKISSIDVEELACYLTGIDYDEIGADEVVIDESLRELYQISLDDFADIVSALLPLIDVGTSALTEKRYKGFADKVKQMWFVKTEIA